MKDENLEERVHEQDPIRLDRRSVEKNRLRRPAEGVGVQDGLDHDQALRQVFPKQTGSEMKKWISISTLIKWLMKR